MDKIIDIVKKNWLVILGITVGVIVGYLYWLIIGCTTGTCPLKETPTISIVLGGVIGGVITSFFSNKKKA